MKLPGRFLVSAAVAVGLTVASVAVASVAYAPPASAASLVEVTNFGPNPTNLRMHLYVPDQVRPQPAVLVASHFCTGSGPVFFSGTEFAAQADQHGFIVVYPSATRSGSCFDVSTQAALQHNGGSDPVGIVSMVNYVLQNHAADPDRVYATGLSSGAMMTNVLLGAYPDVFSAGASFAGVPYSCFATTDGSMWNSNCANGQITRTPQQWGDAVRGAFPGYTGPRPRIQIWHGTNDDTLRYPNFNEQIKQWTNVHGLSQQPTVTDQPRQGWTRTRYGSPRGMAPVEAISVQNGPHNVLTNGMAAETVRFFGLDQTANPPPPQSPPPPPQSPPPPPQSPPPPPVSTCQVAYSSQSWNSGLVANLTLTNTGSAPINGWSLTFTLPAGQSIQSGWSATYAPTSGQVTATNMSYNATIPPGGSIGLGFQATHTGDSGAPAGFTLNGTACSRQ